MSLFRDIAFLLQLKELGAFLCRCSGSSVEFPREKLVARVGGAVESVREPRKPFLRLTSNDRR